MTQQQKELFNVALLSLKTVNTPEQLEVAWKFVKSICDSLKIAVNKPTSIPQARSLADSLKRFVQ